MLKIKDDTVDLKKGCGEMTMKKEVLPGGGDQLLSVGWAVHTQQWRELTQWDLEFRRVPDTA